jgi:hypothetical protein
MKKEYHVSKRKLFANLSLAAGSSILVLLAAEGALRLLGLKFGADLMPRTTPSAESTIVQNDRTGYEYKPYSVCAVWSNSMRFEERRNCEGFRGPDYPIEKPAGTFRILTVGDSVVEGFLQPGLDVPFSQTWQQVMEARLNQISTGSKTRKFEVMNAGIGGYVSWQARVRAEDRGLKYRPDLLLVLVGWNDLAYSSLSRWVPGTDLTRILEPSATEGKSVALRGWWPRLGDTLCRFSYVARLVRQASHNVRNRKDRGQSSGRDRNSGVPFNEEALKLYVANLEDLHRLASTNGVRMGLVLWPTLLTPENFKDKTVVDKLRFSFSIFPLSAPELWNWYQHYIDAQRSFAERHPDVILIDPIPAFALRTGAKRQALFADLGHLTAEGNALLGDTVFGELQRRGLLGGARE